jgi:hypothetical protein
MRQRIGTARINWTMRTRLRAARLAGCSTDPFGSGVPVNSLHLAIVFDHRTIAGALCALA